MNNVVDKFIKSEPTIWGKQEEQNAIETKQFFKKTNKCISQQTELLEQLILYSKKSLSNYLLINSIEVNKKKLGGKPVFKNTRFPISQFLAELTDNFNISEICDDYDLDKKVVIDFLEGLALYLDKPIR